MTKQNLKAAVEGLIEADFREDHERLRSSKARKAAVSADNVVSALEGVFDARGEIADVSVYKKFASQWNEFRAAGRKLSATWEDIDPILPDDFYKAYNDAMKAGSFDDVVHKLSEVVRIAGIVLDGREAFDEQSKRPKSSKVRKAGKALTLLVQAHDAVVDAVRKTDRAIDAAPPGAPAVARLKKYRSTLTGVMNAMPNEIDVFETRGL